MQAFILLAVVAVAAAVPATRTTFTPEPMPAEWVNTARVTQGSATFTVVVQRQNKDKLNAAVAEVTRPHSKTPYLSTDEILDLVRPAASSLSAVEQWLKEAQVSFRLAPTGDRFFVEATYEQAAELFATEFAQYRHVESGLTLTRAGEFSLPQRVAANVEAVFGLHGLPLFPQPRIVTEGVAAITPDVIKQTYNVSGVTISRGTANRQAVAEFQGQFMSADDLKTFFQKYVPSAKPGDDQVYKYVGGQQSGEGVEALLDIQYIMGVVPGIKTEFWEFKNQDFCSDLQNWTSTMLAASDLPLVHSISYGWQGELTQIGCTQDEIKAVDQDFQALAGKGITIIFASGDSGSAYKPKFFGKGTLYPSWPASSPWVTAVGATHFIGEQIGNGEECSDQFGSGGGFSDMFQVPDFQANATKNYLATAPDLPPAKMVPSSGRATPDVAALGQGYQVIVGGVANSVGGTSASTPAFAAIVSLLNEARLAKNLKPIGFLNNWLYKYPDMFYDVTQGSDRVGRSGGHLKYGYSATKGWDPVTGMGTPHFKQMLTHALAQEA